MEKKKQRRIFLGVQEIAGIMERLNNAFRDMGVKSDFYCMDTYGFASDKLEGEQHKILRKYKIHTNNRIQAKKEYERNWWYFLQMWDILYIFFRVLFKYDEFIYIFGHGMFFYNKYLSKIEELEFYILKKLHKKMIMLLCGSDSRAPYCDVYIHSCNNQAERLYNATQKRSKRIRMLEKYMTLIDNPASSHFHTKPYLICNCIGIPVDSKEKVNIAQKVNDKVTILHAPSHQKGKGTEEIRNILKEIKEEGYDFEYIEVSGLPHDIVLEKMAAADIVVDQLYSDTPMAGFAVEAAINGIPVVVGGFYAEVYKKYLPQPIAPTVYCTPDELKERIVYLLEHEEERKRIGEEEKEYVEKNCFSTIVANKFLKIFDNSYPAEWMFNPGKNDYIWGWGVNKELVTNAVVKMIDNYGTVSLRLDESSKVYKKYIRLYEEAKKKLG